jgi:serine/threonine protein kinase
MSEQSSGDLSFEERFRIIAKIGSGCYGDVYKAYDNKHQRIVALKKIRVFDLRAGLPTAFYREIGTLNNISHPNVVTLFETVRNATNDIFLEMEYCQYDLEALITTRLSPSQCLSYFTQICTGIAELHSRDITHRDLKPGNILVTSNNVCKITDFGLSRKMDSNNSRYTPLVGSGSYRAPEVIAETGNYDSSIDIWALGCILFQMVSKNSKRFILGGRDLKELQELASIYGSEALIELSQFPSFAPFLSTFTPKLDCSLSSYLSQHIPSKNQWAIPLLEQMLQLNPKKRPNISSVLDALSSLSILDASKLPQLDIIESHGYDSFIGNNVLCDSISKYAISPPRISPIMVPIYA